MGLIGNQHIAVCKGSSMRFKVQSAGEIDGFVSFAPDKKTKLQ